MCWQSVDCTDGITLTISRDPGLIPTLGMRVEVESRPPLRSLGFLSAPTDVAAMKGLLSPNAPPLCRLVR